MKAVKDTWIIGDGFLYDIFTSYQAAKTEASIDKFKPPYMYDYYNIHYGFHPPLSQIKSTEARISNSLIELLNSKEFKLPKYILIIPDKDLIEGVLSQFCDYGFKKVFRASIKWLMNDINKTLSIRKEALRSKRGGALSTSAEPRLIWISIIKRPINIHDDVKAVYKLVRKANEVLEDVVRKFDKYSHFIQIDTLNEHKFFDSMGKLTATGKSTFWREIDGKMRKFDRGENELNIHEILEERRKNKQESDRSRESGKSLASRYRKNYY